MSAGDIHRQITEIYGTEETSDSVKVRKWVRKFKDVRTNVHDQERPGRPSVITDDLMQTVETKKIVITGDSRKPLFHWNFPTFLAEQKERRFAVSLDFLIRYEEEGDGTLSRRVSHITPESKQQSNNNQLMCLLRNSTEVSKSIAKQTARHAVKRRSSKKDSSYWIGLGGRMGSSFSNPDAAKKSGVKFRKIICRDELETKGSNLIGRYGIDQWEELQCSRF
ncbi:uncharacterized protein TNCV_4389191 [Trichonephila clavipes]|nr:uncharacterized protein TNCV_4389191 [Trichonephila clavipes]